MPHSRGSGRASTDFASTEDDKASHSKSSSQVLHVSTSLDTSKPTPAPSDPAVEIHPFSRTAQTIDPGSVSQPAAPEPPVVPPYTSLEREWGVVIGRISLQNTLLCKTLSRELGIVCELATEDAGLATIPDVVLQLLDIDMLGLDKVIDYLGQADADEHTLSIALFNLTEKQDAELIARYRGWPALQGVFQRDCEPSTLVNGVRCILDGHLWLPRRYLEAFVRRHHLAADMVIEQPIMLTRKEEQILRVMISGYTNAEIAEHLSISPHTVKTHIYNLYKKLKVTNRIEAVTWGRRNLSLPDTLPESE